MSRSASGALATACRSQLRGVGSSSSSSTSAATRSFSASTSSSSAAAAPEGSNFDRQDGPLHGSSSSSNTASSGEQSETDERSRRGARRVMLDYVSSIGSSTQTRESSYRPYKTRLEPLTAKELAVSHLLAATAQVGHSISNFARANQANVYGVRHKLAIIDVEKATLPALRRAAAVVRSVCERDGIVLFLGTRPGQQAAVIAAAKRLGENGYHVTTDRWLPGSITNAPKILSGAVTHVLGSPNPTSLTQSRESTNPNATKLAAITLQPDLLVVLNPTENLHAIREATQCNIPTMAIIDTDVDPRTVTYPIPANDDSLRAVELIVGVLSKAGEQGLRDRERKLDEQDKMMRKAARRPASTGYASPSTSAGRAAAGPRNEFAEAREREEAEDAAGGNQEEQKPAAS